MRQASLENYFWPISLTAAILTIAWCSLLGARNVERISLALATSFSAFLLGSLVGFIFTIFGDEVEPLGKIRDAMIAVASGIAGISIAKVGHLRALIGSIQLFGTASEESSWFTILFVLVYFIGGFYFMYLLRKFELNPALAKSRKELQRIEISGHITSVAIEIEGKIPEGLLLGRESFAEMIDREEDVGNLRSTLYSDEVNRFLESCQKELDSGSSISSDSIKKAAVLHYCRSYIPKDDTGTPAQKATTQEAQADRAIEWISRALVRDPMDTLLQIKLADLFGMRNRYDDAISIFERLERDEDSPQYVQEWLGYFLLFKEGREGDAIRHSEAFHNRFPSNGNSLFNASCGYAQLYTKELESNHAKTLPKSEYRTQSLHLLKQSIEIDGALKRVARKQSKANDSFESLASDSEFLGITAPETAADQAAAV